MNFESYPRTLSLWWEWFSFSRSYLDILEFK